MFPRKKRLNRRMFNELLAGGKSVFSPVFTARFFPVKEKSSRFSFIAPKSVAKSAVLRNTLRRRGYAALRGMEEEISPGFVCVFFFKKGSENLKTKEIKEELRVVLRRARLLK